MLTTEERRLQLEELVRKMRTAQEELLIHPRHPRQVENAKYYERQVDRALKRLRHREPSDA